MTLEHCIFLAVHQFIVQKISNHWC